MLFVDDDQPEAAERREHRRARADDDVDVAAADAMPLIVALAVGQAAVLDRHPLAEGAAERLGDGRRQRDLRHQQQHAPAAGPDVRGEADVDLGLAAAGDTVQERGMERPRIGKVAQARECCVLLGGQREVGPGAEAGGRRGMKRIAFDAAADERDQAERRQPRQRRR